MAASYPTSIWDGDSLNRDSDNSPRKSPDWRDWNRLIEEMMAVQTQTDTNISDIDALEAGITVEVESVGKSGAPNILLDSESLKVLVNEATLGEMNFHTLPTAVAGLVFTFVCDHVQGIRVKAAAGDTIQLNGSTSKVAGYAESTTAGSIVKLICIDAVQWVATTVVGVWVLETS